MAVKRKTYWLRVGDVIDVEEYHDGNYGAPGKQRVPKEKATKEQIMKNNARNKTQRCRRRLLEYFDSGDCFATWTYQVSQRPEDMSAALKDFQKAMRIVRREYKKRGRELRWIRNIERGTKGAWHIHLVVNEIGDTASILKEAWRKGGTYVSEIRLNDKIFDEDFSKLASYMTKNENTAEFSGEGKTRIRESNYGTSKNMPLPEPKVDKLVRWKKDPKPKKGYYISSTHEGVNPVTGFLYRRYTMIRIRKEKKSVKRNAGRKAAEKLQRLPAG